MANFGIRTDPSGNFAAITSGTEDVVRFGGAAGDNSGQLAGFRNVLINSTFQINNGNAGTPYVSGAVLAAGQTGHECWKAGASGGDYTFTQNPAITQITIALGKSLIQVIENKFVEGGVYCISWAGTAKARIGINTATPSGAYTASPIVVTGQTTGAVMSVEFTNNGTDGTLSRPQVEIGSVASKYEFGANEESRTLRYFYKSPITSTNQPGYFLVPYPVPMYAIPAVSFLYGAGYYSITHPSNSGGTYNCVDSVWRDFQLMSIARL